jgi:hypothetical protein
MQLPSPSIKYDVDLFAGRQGTSVPMKEAKLFSRERKKVYRSTRPFDMDIVRYIHPEIVMNKTKRPFMNDFARSLSRWADIRSLIFDGKTSGKITYCLDDEAVADAPYRQRYARDPWEARATGGYKILTQHRTTRGASEEDDELAEIILRSSDYSSALLSRKDYKYLPERLLLEKTFEDEPPDVPPQGLTHLGISDERREYFMSLLQGERERSPSPEHDELLHARRTFDEGVLENESVEADSCVEDLFFSDDETEEPDDVSMLIERYPETVPDLGVHTYVRDPPRDNDIEGEDMALQPELYGYGGEVDFSRTPLEKIGLWYY